MENAQSLVNHLEIKQVGMVVKDMQKAIRQISALWAIGSVKYLELDLPDATVRGETVRLKAKLAFAQVGPVELEWIEPGEGENIYWEFLRNKGEGVHHLGVFVTDIESELARFKEMGIEVLQSGTGPDGTSFAYMDTERICGIIVELLQHKQSTD